MPELPKVVPSAHKVFSEMDFDDLWEDARMVSIVHWLRGGTDLRIPDRFRPFLPQRL